MTTRTQTFEAALAQFDAFTKTAKWIETPRATEYNDVAAMEAAVDEAIAEDEVAERAALWSAVAATEAEYRSVVTLNLTDLCKIDGREG